MPDGLTGEAITSLAEIGSAIFAGTAGGGVRRLLPDDTWARLDEGLLNSTVTAMHVSGNNILSGTDGGGVFFASARDAEE